MTQDSLLPCPFCGDIALLEGLGNRRGGLDRNIICTNCNVMTPDYLTEAEAIATWNRRAPDPALEALADFFAEIQDCVESIQGALRHYQQPQDYHFHKALKACRDGAALFLYRQRSKT